MLPFGASLGFRDLPPQEWHPSFEVELAAAPTKTRQLLHCSASLATILLFITTLFSLNRIVAFNKRENNLFLKGTVRDLIAGASGQRI